MMSDLPDFLTMIAERRAQIKGRIAELRSELNALKAAEETYRAGNAPKVAASDAQLAGTGKTIKDLVIDVLADHAQGADAHGIIALIAKKHGIIIQRPSLSPQLSRLKQDGLLELEGITWKAAGPRERGPDDKSEPLDSTTKSKNGAGQSDDRTGSHLSVEGASPSRSTSALARNLLSSTARIPVR
jgi:hypothetical protein